MSYTADYRNFMRTAAQAPLENATRLVFCDNCDDDVDTAGGTRVFRGNHGESTAARGSLVRVQMELENKPRDPDLLHVQDELLTRLAPMLREEIQQLGNLQHYVAPSYGGDLATLNAAGLAQIYENGFIGYAEFDGRGFPGGRQNPPAPVGEGFANPLAEVAAQIPLTRVRLRMGRDTHSWLTSDIVKQLPGTLKSVDIEHALRDRAAQDALFAHPTMAHVQHLRLTPPASGWAQHVSIDPGLGSPAVYNPNQNQDQDLEAVNANFVRRLTSGPLSKDLKTLDLDYNILTNEGLRALASNPKLKNTVINFEFHNYTQCTINNRQDWANQVEPGVWRDLAVHNSNAARSQGGNYVLPEFMKETLNNARGWGQWLRGRRIETVDDLPVH